VTSPETVSAGTAPRRFRPHRRCPAARPARPARARATLRCLVDVHELKVWFPITEGIVFERHVGDVRRSTGSVSS